MQWYEKEPKPKRDDDREFLIWAKLRAKRGKFSQEEIDTLEYFVNPYKMNKTLYRVKTLSPKPSREKVDKN